MIFLNLRNSARHVTTNLTLFEIVFRKIKIIPTLPQSLVTPLMAFSSLLIFGLLSDETLLVHQNPGTHFHFHIHFQDNFRVHLIETHNPIFNYDLISICGQQTLCMAESVRFSPLRPEMICLNESIVAELNIGRFFFFTVIHRSPAFNHTSSEFMDFLSNFNNLYSKIKTENLYTSFFYCGF